MKKLDANLSKEIRTYYDRSQKNIDDWLNAWISAKPNKSYSNLPANYQKLQDIYDLISTESTTFHCLRTRFSKVLSQNITVKNDAGEVDEEATKLINKRWFKVDLIKEILKSKFYGFSLLEWNIDINNEISGFTSFERRNVSPEERFIKVNPHDTYGIHWEGTEIEDYYTLIHTGLGELLNVAPSVIYRRFSLGSWAESAETNHIPSTVLKTASEDQSRLSELEEMLLSGARNKMYIINPEEELESFDTSSSHQLYKELEQTCKDDITKMILGSTGTTDMGSSYSQSKVHSETSGYITEEDVHFVEHVVTDVIFPTFSKLSSKYSILEGKKLCIEQEVQRSLEDKLKIISTLSKSGYKIDTEQISEWFNLDIEENININTPDISDEDDDI